MKVSIAMATYNGVKYLPEQLQSIVAQTHRPDELVISDDNSTDGTYELVADFAASAPFTVSCFQNSENLGHVRNFSAAMERTNGELVFLCDQDDVWLPDKISSMIALAQSRPEKLLLTNDALLTDAQLKDRGLTKLGQIRSQGHDERKFVMGCCFAIRRELLDLCLPVPHGLAGHDNWIAGIADGLGVRLMSDRVLQLYRRHGLNESNIIANQTSKVTRWHRMQRQLGMALEASSVERARLEIEQRLLFLEGVRAACSRASGSRLVALEGMVVSVEDEINMLRRRFDIRARPFLSRTGRALGLYLAGGYRQSAGLKSVIRDLMG